MARPKSQNKILLVNGDATLQQLRALMLRMKGYEVHSATSLDEAKAILAESEIPFRLVIVDVGYFTETGLQFCEEIKKAHPRLRVLMQANNQFFLDPNSCPDSVVSKQDGPQTFVSEVESLLEPAPESA